jgi:hypothetical protein
LASWLRRSRSSKARLRGISEPHPLPTPLIRAAALELEVGTRFPAEQDEKIIVKNDGGVSIRTGPIPQCNGFLRLRRGLLFQRPSEDMVCRAQNRRRSGGRVGKVRTEAVRRKFNGSCVGIPTDKNRVHPAELEYSAQQDDPPSRRGFQPRGGWPAGGAFFCGRAGSSGAPRSLTVQWAKEAVGMLPSVRDRLRRVTGFSDWQSRKRVTVNPRAGGVRKPSDQEATPSPVALFMMRLSRLDAQNTNE